MPLQPQRKNNRSSKGNASKAKSYPTPSGKVFIGGYVDVSIADALQAEADQNARGNRSHILEEYLKAGLKKFAAGCQTPSDTSCAVLV